MFFSSNWNSGDLKTTEGLLIVHRAYQLPTGGVDLRAWLMCLEKPYRAAESTTLTPATQHLTHSLHSLINRRGPHYYWDRELLKRFDAAIDSRDVDSIYEVGMRLGYSDWEIDVKWMCRERDNRNKARESAKAQIPEQRRIAIAKRFGVPPSYVMLENEIAEWQASRSKAKRADRFFNVLKCCVSGALAACTELIGLPISRAGTK